MLVPAPLCQRSVQALVPRLPQALRLRQARPSHPWKYSQRQGQGTKQGSTRCISPVGLGDRPWTCQRRRRPQQRRLLRRSSQQMVPGEEFLPSPVHPEYSGMHYHK